MIWRFDLLISKYLTMVLKKFIFNHSISIAVHFCIYWNFCIKGWTQITLHAKERTLYYTKVLSNLYKAVYCLILIRKFRLLLDLWPIILKSLHKRAIEKNNNDRPDDNNDDNDNDDVDCFPLKADRLWYHRTSCPLHPTSTPLLLV